jgi:non-heme Fe2+,alpha-ketoglutarate-dependent halogenase
MSAVDSLGLTDEQVTFFKENGFVGPFDLYDADEAQLIWNQAKIEMVLSANKPHESTTINYDRHLDCAALSGHVTRPEIVHKLRSLMGDDIICWRSNIFKKDPGESGTGWHQVEHFVVGETTTASAPALTYTEAPTQVSQEITVWTAFTPSRKENGCLRFIPGSHKRWYYDETKSLTFNVESKTHDFFGYDYSELKLDPDWDPEDAGPVDMEMDAGQFVFFVAKCIHGSQPNVTDQPRLGYASRYVVPSVKTFDKVDRLSEFGDEIDMAYHGCVLVSGEDRYGYNRLYTENLNGTPFEKVWP